jgi:hypothetical protein
MKIKPNHLIDDSSYIAKFGKQKMHGERRHIAAGTEISLKILRKLLKKLAP